jgi:hypothetical protein
MAFGSVSLMQIKNGIPARRFPRRLLSKDEARRIVAKIVP